jgi:hypothetical protein
MLKINKFFLLLILLLPIMSANGLNVLNNTQISINKTIGVDQNVIIDIANQDSFDFYNVTFEDNDYIKMDPISVIASGTTHQVTATIFSDLPFTGEVKIQGFYESDLGVSDREFLIDVYYDTGVDPCGSFNIVQGDRVTWVNHVSDSVKLMNSVTNAEIATIIQGGNYTSVFDTPLELNYHVNRRGFTFTDHCEINALGTTGLIHNSDYDATINLNLGTTHLPTNLTANFIETAYSMSFNGDAEGIFTIKNTGAELAKNIKISAEWLSFNVNNIDLSPGQTKGIVYTINPTIFNTNQTNKTHEIPLTIEGNFPTITQNFSVHITYTNISDSDLQAGNSLITIIEQFCNENPDASFCTSEPVVVYRNTNESNEAFNVSMNQEQVREIFAFMFEQGDEYTAFRNFMKETIDSINSDINQTRDLQNTIKLQIEEQVDDEDNKNTIIYFGIGSVAFLVIISISGYLVYYYRKKRIRQNIQRGTVLDD